MKVPTRVRSMLIWTSVLAAFPLVGQAQSPTPVLPVPNPCTPRFSAGSTIAQPPALFSQNGVLNVRFSYQQTTDSSATWFIVL